MFQLLSGWADGPVYATQCPIRPGQSYTYKFTITGQEGTLWWHGHVQWLRATVYGALIIRPRAGHKYPFPKPHREFPIILGTYLAFRIISLRPSELEFRKEINLLKSFLHHLNYMEMRLQESGGMLMLLMWRTRDLPPVLLLTSPTLTPSTGNPEISIHALKNVRIILASSRNM